MKLRASQINGCGHCVDMHARDARQSGETERRLYAVAVWREMADLSLAIAAINSWNRLAVG